MLKERLSQGNNCFYNNVSKKTGANNSLKIKTHSEISTIFLIKLTFHTSTLIVTKSTGNFKTTNYELIFSKFPNLLTFISQSKTWLSPNFNHKLLSKGSVLC